MTIPEHIEILRRGPRIWNAWRDENPSVVPDLAGVALSIGDRQMGPINGGPINLSRALLTEATLYYATLTGADLRGSDLKNADLRGARLEGVDLTGADLAGAQLDGASLTGAVLKAANLSGASLADVSDLTEDQIVEAEGNLVTVLPSNLERPAVWTGGEEFAGFDTGPVVAPEPAFDVANEEDAEEQTGVGAPINNDPISFSNGAETAAEPDQVTRPEIVCLSEAESEHQEVGSAEADPESETIAARQVETPAPVLPRVKPELPRTVSEQSEPKSTVTSEPMRPNGNEAQVSSESSDSENKHVSWLVGGPRRAGRPARNWRDRA